MELLLGRAQSSPKLSQKRIHAGDWRQTYKLDSNSSGFALNSGRTEERYLQVSTPSMYQPIQISLATLQITNKSHKNHPPHKELVASSQNQSLPIPQIGSGLSNLTQNLLLSSFRRRQGQGCKSRQVLGGLQKSSLSRESRKQQVPSSIQLKQLPSPAPRRTINPNSPSKKNLEMYRKSTLKTRNSMIIAKAINILPAQPQKKVESEDEVKISPPGSPGRVSISGGGQPDVQAALDRTTVQTVRANRDSPKFTRNLTQTSAASPKSVMSDTILRSPKFEVQITASDLGSFDEILKPT